MAVIERWSDYMGQQHGFNRPDFAATSWYSGRLLFILFAHGALIYIFSLLASQWLALKMRIYSSRLKSSEST